MGPASLVDRSAAPAQAGAPQSIDQALAALTLLPPSALAIPRFGNRRTKRPEPAKVGFGWLLVFSWF